MGEVAVPTVDPSDTGSRPPVRRGVPWWRPTAVVVAGSLMVRVALAHAGNGYRPTHVRPSMWHLLEADQLAANPFAPLWDVHTTPPLFNVAVGVLLRWSPLPESTTFRLVFVAGGLFGAVALCHVLMAVGCRWWVASLTAVVTFSKPAVLAVETYVAHESLVVPLLMGTVWAVAAYARRRTLGRYGLVLLAATALVLMRALFTPLWLVAVAAVLLAWPPEAVDRRHLVLVTALPFVVVLGVMTKNQVRFGTFSLSSWAGMNLSRAALTPLGDETIERMVADGELSPLARITWFSPYEEYEPLFGACETDFGTRVLDDPAKDDGSAAFPNANYNAACYLPVYEQAMTDSLSAIRHQPGVYARTVWASSLLYMSDTRRAYELGALGGTTAEILDRAHALMNLERTTTARYPSLFPVPADVQLTLVAGLVLVVGAGARSLRRRLRGTATARDLVAVVVAVTVLNVTAVGITFDAFENGRFREPLDPLVFGALLAGGLESAVRAWQRRRAPAPGQVPAAPEPVDQRG
jgi:hypothetical protein